MCTIDRINRYRIKRYQSEGSGDLVLIESRRRLRTRRRRRRRQRRRQRRRKIDGPNNRKNGAVASDSLGKVYMKDFEVVAEGGEKSVGDVQKASILDIFKKSQIIADLKGSKKVIST